MLPGFCIPGPAGFSLLKSYTFASASSMSMTRTPGSAGRRQKYTLHMRIKRVSTGAEQTIFRADAANTDAIVFLATDKVRIQVADTIRRTTTATYTDTASWHEWIFAYDMSLGTNNCIRIYYDGTEVTAFDVLDNPAAGTNGNINNTGAHNFGFTGSGNYLNAKVADVHFIDSLQLDSASFSSGGSPIQYAGSYGSGGLAGWITFANATSTTTLGQDDAGGLQGSAAGAHDWTTTNFNTANATTDVPT